MMDQLSIVVGALDYFKSPHKMGPREFPQALIIRWYMEFSEGTPWLAGIDFEKVNITCTSRDTCRKEELQGFPCHDVCWLVKEGIIK